MVFSRTEPKEIKKPFEKKEKPYKKYTVDLNCPVVSKLLIIEATSNMTTFICSLGQNIFGKQVDISFASLIDNFSSTSMNNLNIFSLNGILTGMLSISSFTLIMSFALRYIIIKVLIILSPFAIICLINPSTSGLFKSWFKCFLTLLFLQLFISLVLLLSYAIIKETTTSPFKELLLVGTIMALLKSNEYVKELMGGLNISSNFSSGVAGLKSIFSR